MATDISGTSISIVTGTVVAIQGNAVKPESLGSNQDGTFAVNNFSNSLASITLNAVYAASYGDIIDVRIEPANGSDPTNRPIVYLVNFNVIGV